MRGVPLMMMILILINTSEFIVSGANLWDSNATNNIIAYQDQEMEFQMDSESNRRILADSKPVYMANQGAEPARCGRQGARYTPCPGPGTGGPDNYCRSIFNRDCK